MIKILEKKNKKKKQDPYYLLKFNYMIGDARGYTNEETAVGIEDAEIVERFVKLMNKLKPTKGHWGIMLEDDRIYEHFQEGQMTEDDFNFLSTVLFEDWEDEEEEEDEVENKYKHLNGYFSDCVRADAEYSFLIFEGIDLYYYDEYGIKYDTEIVD